MAALLGAASLHPVRPLVAWSAPERPAAIVVDAPLADPAVRATPIVLDVRADEAVRLAIGSSRQIYDRLVAEGYSLDRVRAEAAAVPRVLARSLPADLPLIESPDQRKAVFIKMMLPLLLVQNERIMADRARIEALRDAFNRAESIAGIDIDWLAATARRYGVDSGDFDGLLRRVDAVPPSLAIAQAALETGWGTSRVAQRGNAMFGQMEMRGGQEPVLAVKTFGDLAAAVAAYTHNLNTHRAYAPFRAERAAFRERGLLADGHELAAHIWRYSERGMDYVRDVQGIIRSNRLRPFDPARLAG